MNLEKFTTYITHIQQSIDCVTELNKVFRKYNTPDTYFGDSSLIDDMVALLETTLNDTDNWISYWLFELDCGRKYIDDTVIINSKPIPLRTIEDLWNVLNEMQE